MPEVGKVTVDVRGFEEVRAFFEELQKQQVQLQAEVRALRDLISTFGDHNLISALSEMDRKAFVAHLEDRQRLADCVAGHPVGETCRHCEVERAVPVIYPDSPGNPFGTRS